MYTEAHLRVADGTTSGTSNDKNNKIKIKSIKKNPTVRSSMNTKKPELGQKAAPAPIKPPAPKKNALNHIKHPQKIKPIKRLSSGPNWSIGPKEGPKSKLTSRTQPTLIKFMAEAKLRKLGQAWASTLISKDSCNINELGLKNMVMKEKASANDSAQ